MKIHTQIKKPYILGIVLFIIVCFLSFFLFQKYSFSLLDEQYHNLSLKKRVSLFKDTPVFQKLYLVSNSHDRALGLSRFEDFSEKEAMLFVFEYPAAYSFWMKDMKFPIDIVWADEFGVIVDIKEHANPKDFPETYIPKKEALYVLELTDGFVNEHEVQLGQTLVLDGVLEDKTTRE